MSDSNTESSAASGQVGHAFMATFMDSIRKGIESVSELPNDLTAKIEEAIGELEERFETRIQTNRAGLFKWTGIPDPEQLKQFQDTIERLENRLQSIEQNIDALEEHPKGQPWPDQKPKRRKSRA